MRKRVRDGVHAEKTLGSFICSWKKNEKSGTNDMSVGHTCAHNNAVRWTHPYSTGLDQNRNIAKENRRLGSRRVWERVGWGRKKKLKPKTTPDVLDRRQSGGNIERRTQSNVTLVNWKKEEKNLVASQTPSLIGRLKRHNLILLHLYSCTLLAVGCSCVKSRHWFNVDNCKPVSKPFRSIHLPSFLLFSA